MSRYIDYDALMKELDKEVEEADDWNVAHEIANVAKYFPTADVVEIVRCKDCKYWRPDTRSEDSLEDRTDGLWGWGNLCVKHLPADELEAIEFGPEEFCNFGERKE